MIENLPQFLNAVSRVYRTLLALTGSSNLAERGAVEMVSQVALRMIRARNPRQFEIWLAKAILDRASSPEAIAQPAAENEGKASATSTDPFATVAALPPEPRAWAALRLAGGMSHRLAGEALGLNQRGITLIEEQFHSLLLAQPVGAGASSPSQIESELARAMRDRPVPESLLSQANDAISRAVRQQKTGARKVFRPALIAAACSLVIALGLVGIQVWEKLNRFPGSEHAERLLAKAGPLPGKEFDEIEPGPHGLKDWLFIAKPDGLPAPVESAISHLNLPVRKARTFVFEGADVIEGLSENGEMTVLLFSASQLGLTLEEEGRWHRLQAHGWEAAVKREGDSCLLVATKEGRKHLAELTSK